jgi:hypothetical protein
MRAAWLAFVAVAVLAACGSRTSLAPASEGNREGERATGDASGGFEAGSAESAAPDTGPCSPIVPSGGVCNDLSPLGPSVLVECLGNAPPPEPSGGTLSDGLYALTRSRFYGACPTGEQDQITWSLCGTQWATLQSSTPPKPPARNIDGQVTVSSTSILFQPTCPSSGVPQETYGYDATPTEITLHVYEPGLGSVRVDTLTRQ